MAEITSKGFSGKTLIQYKTEITGLYYGIDPLWDLSPETIDGESVAINAEMFANLDDKIGLAYAACDPATAQGQAMVNIADISGVHQKDATYSTCPIKISGVDGAVIPAGKKVRNKTTNTLWALDSGVTISGLTDASVTCVEAGAKTAGVGDLSIIADPIGGWQSVTNPTAAVLGKDVESINELRVRRNNSVAKPSNNQLDSLRSRLSSVEGVTHLFVDENEELATDANGVLGKSYIVFISGADNDEIAKTMASCKNPGCGQNFSNTTFPNKQVVNTTTPIHGNKFRATFFRPDLKTIYVDVKVKKTGEFTLDIESQIKSAIIEYANATLFKGVTSLGFDSTGFEIGEDIPAGKLHTPVNKVVAENGYTLSIDVSLTDGGAGSLVNIAYGQLGVFSEAEIKVTIS